MAVVPLCLFLFTSPFLFNVICLSFFFNKSNSEVVYGGLINFCLPSAWTAVLTHGMQRPDRRKDGHCRTEPFKLIGKAVMDERWSVSTQNLTLEFIFPLFRCAVASL